VTSDQYLERYFGVVAGGRLPRAVRTALAWAVDPTGGSEGSLLAHDEQANDLCFVMTARNPESEAALLGQRVPLGQGITGLAAASGEVQVGAPVFKDVQQTERLSDGPEAVLAAPVQLGEELVGVITAVTFEPGRRFGAAEAGRFARAAAVIAALLEAARGQVAAGGLQPLAYGAAAQREEAVIERLRLLARRDPDAVAAIEQLLQAVERLAALGRA